MEFWLRSYTDGIDFHFPVPPQDSAPVQQSTRKVTFQPLSTGARSYPRGVNEKTTQLSGLFTGDPKRLPSKDWQPAKDCADLLNRWQQEGHRLAYTVTGAPRANQFDCFIDGLTLDTGPSRGDIKYTLTLCQWGYLTVPTVSEAELASDATPTAPVAPDDVTPTSDNPDPLNAQPPADEPGTTYTVKPGDSLWEIARDKLGDGSLWPSLYAANADVIGGDPNALTTGMILVIPSAGEAAAEQAAAAEAAQDSVLVE